MCQDLYFIKVSDYSENVVDTHQKPKVPENNKREAGASLLFQPKLLLLMKTNL
jgi:hypothetical protein